jgi:hypothetical protein
MRRTMQVLNGLGPQETEAVYEFPYDHPYFGQLFLAGVLSITGYPHFLFPQLDISANSVRMLYELPRLIMGILAVIDTFLVFKIGEIRYGRRIGFISSVIFAVMPVTWFLRMVVLESIMLPFLLSSILLLLHKSKVDSSSAQPHPQDKTDKKSLVVIMLSGILFGLASFTKESAVTLIPLLGYLLYLKVKQTQTNRLKIVAIWVLPVVILSSIWPLYSMAINQFGNWFDGVLYQVQREERGLDDPLIALIQIDPIFSVLSIAAVIFALIKVVVFKNKDLFFFFWSVPYFLFLFLIGGAVKYFHFTILVPVLIIEIALFIVFISKQSRKKVILNPLFIMAGIAIVGFISTLLMISNDLTSTFFNMYSSILHALPQGASNSDIVTMIGKHWARSFYWIPKYIFGQDIGFKVIDPVLYPQYTTKSDKVLLILDKSVISQLKSKEKNEDYINQIRPIYRNSTLFQSITENWTQPYYPEYYPFTSIDSLLGKIGRLDIRSNYK